MNTLETRVLEYIGEDTDSPDVFTDDTTGMAQIRDSLNDAIEEISLLTGSYRTTYAMAMREDRTFYRFRFSRGYLAWITNVWLVTQKRRLEQTSLLKLKNHNPRWLYNTGSPRAYFPIGFNYLGIWPKPGSDTDLLEIEMVLIPRRYETDTEEIKLRNNFERAAIHYAVGEYFASRGDAQTAVYHHQKYLDRVGLSARYPYANDREWRLQSAKEIAERTTG